MNYQTLSDKYFTTFLKEKEREKQRKQRLLKPKRIFQGFKDKSKNKK